MEVRQLYYKDENGVEHPYCPVVGEESVFDSSGVSVGRKLQGKQDKLIAGDGISIGEDGKTISCSSTPVDAYTKTEVDNKLATKQDLITDISAIRSGAGAGATALQPDALEGYVQKDGNKVLSDNNYTTEDKQKVQNALTEHQPLTDYCKSMIVYATNTRPFTNGGYICDTDKSSTEVKQFMKEGGLINIQIKNPIGTDYYGVITGSQDEVTAMIYVGDYEGKATIAFGKLHNNILTFNFQYIYYQEAIDNKFEKIVDVLNIDDSSCSISIGEQESDTDYKCGVLTSLSITSVSAISKEVNIFFSTGDVVENMPSIPSGVNVVGDIEIQPNKSYVMSIYQGVICCQETK